MASKTNKLQDNANSIFNKRYTLKSKDDVYALPRIETMYSSEPFKVEQLMTLKDKLNRTKSLLDDKDIEPWRRHTSKTNPCGLVVKHLREKINPELCTQAWAKFYEIASSCNIIPTNCIRKGRLKTFHLCEAPGAFIASLNHYVKSTFEGMEWNWLASTLNPFYEGNDTKRMIEGEKFILETEAHWEFGVSYDGDIMDWSNLEQLQRAMGGSEKADMVTADGSIDCADEPEKQETAISQLLYCEVIAALLLLAPGGSLVVKMFTMFEHSTICLLYLLCCFFTEVNIVKPGTSKAGNSEVYCVCNSFTGAKQLSSELLEKLQQHYGCHSPGKSMFPLNLLPTMFLDSVVNCAKTFTENQKNAITRNIELFENFSKGRRKFLSSLRQFLAEEYVYRFDVSSIDQGCFVVPHVHLNGSQLSWWSEVAKEDVWQHHGHHTGCYQERMEKTKLSWHDKIVFPHTELSSFRDKEQFMKHIFCDDPVRWLSAVSSPVLKSDLNGWTVRLGKSITKIESSRFCPSSLIGELNEARENATVLQTRGEYLIKEIEQLTRKKLGILSDDHSGIVSVLRTCNLIDDEAKLRYVDISGNGRFICSLINLGLCQSSQCSAVLCQNCDSQHCPVDHNISVTSCMNYHESVAERVRSVWSGQDSRTVACGGVFTTCGQLENNGELASRRSLVNQCLVALRLLDDGGSFVCEVSDTLTQLTIGVIYILHQVFREVSLCPVVGRLRYSPKQFLVCRYLSSSANPVYFTEHLTKVLDVFKRKSNNEDVVSLVPISKLFSEQFYMYMRAQTTGHVKGQVECIVNLERLLLANERSE